MDYHNNIGALKTSLYNQNQNITDIEVTSFVTIDAVTYYEITFKNSTFQWNVWHRFSELHDLHTFLTDSLSSTSARTIILPSIPSKQVRYFYNHTDVNFIVRRKMLITQYLNQLKKIVVINSSNIFKDFAINQYISHPELKREIKMRVLKEARNTLKDVTDVSIDSWTISHDHVIYHIRFSNSNKEGPYASWLCLKRYDEFDSFHKELKDYIGGLPSSMNPEGLGSEGLPQLPEKKIKFITDHTQHSFLEKRRMALEEYLRCVIEKDTLSKSPVFLKFAGVISDHERTVM